MPRDGGKLDGVGFCNNVKTALHMDGERGAWDRVTSVLLIAWR